MINFPFSRLQVQGSSMLPTFSPGQFLISFNWFLLLKREDIVVIKKAGKLMVKRVRLIKSKEVFLVGDNPAESTDSRQFGWVSKDQIVGRVIFKYN